MKKLFTLLLVTLVVANLHAQSNVNANGLNIGRYGGPYLGYTNPFTFNTSSGEGTNEVMFLGNDASTLHVRLLDGNLNFGPNQSATSTFYNNGSLFLGGSVGTRLTISGSGKLNLRLGRWVSLSETGGGIATVIGNNIQSSTSADNFMQYIETSTDGARAIKMQYDEGITFHAFYGSATANGQMTGVERMRIDNYGRVGIGTASPQNALDVNGVIRSKEVKVEASWPDYVFAKDYTLLTLEKIEAYIAKYHHLPEVPSADEVKKDGIQLGEMNATLLKKIEELTLYVIDLKKQNDVAMDEIKKLKETVNK